MPKDICYATIQAAIDASLNGDKIEVAAGTYNEAINFNGKAIRLYSKDGPEVTTIDANGIAGAYHVVQCVSGENANTILEGFTITGGHASGSDLNSYGGGMLTNESSPTVTNCIFTGNSADAHGGGMLNYGWSSPTVTNCTFEGNSAGTDGGGMYNGVNSRATVTNCTFEGNSAGTGGAGGYGAGMYNIALRFVPTMVINCTFEGNWAATDGGGMYNNDTLYSPTVTNCILWGNEPNEISNEGSSDPNITYSDVQGGWGDPNDPNNTNIDAEPLFLKYKGNNNLRLGVRSPCVDAGNNAAVPAGVTTDLDGKPRFVDDANIPDTGIGTPPIVDMGAYERQIDSAPPVSKGGALYWTIGEAIDEAIEGDIIEVSPATFHEVIDFNGLAITLRSTDPNDPNVVVVIDATDLGSSAVICNNSEGPDTVLAGFTITGGHATSGGGMYCKNSSPTVTNCNFSYNIADCNGGGMYCENSSPTVTGCLFYRNSTSDGNDGWYPDVPGSDAGHGGGMYNLNSSPIISCCDFVENRTGSGGDGGHGWNADWWDNGHPGAAAGDAGDGAGMYNYLGSPTVTYCNFRLNETGAGGNGGEGGDEGPCGDHGGKGGTGGYGGNGAAMFNKDSSSSPIVTYCDFSENTAGSGGRGGAGEASAAPCDGVAGDGGSGGHGANGAAMYNFRSSPTVTNCTFKANVAGDGGNGGNGRNCTGDWDTPSDGGVGGTGGDGAGMVNIISSPYLINCTFTANASGNGGDGGYKVDVQKGDGGDGGSGGDGAVMYNKGIDAYPSKMYSSPKLTNCTFIGNATGTGGNGGTGTPAGSPGSGGDGGVMYGYVSNPTVTNCTFSGNSADWGGGMCNQTYCNPTVTNCILWGDTPDEIHGGSPTVSYSDIQGGWGDPNDPNNTNINCDPSFVDAAGGNLQLLFDSPCIDAGDNNSIPADTADLDGDGNTTEPTPFDLKGQDRILDGDCDGIPVVDMGVYEFSYAYIGDFDYNCTVNFKDFAIFAMAWLTEPPESMWNQFCDIGIPPDGYIDLYDLDVLVENWLSEFRINIYDVSLDSDPGWTTEGQWAFGQPTGAGGSEGGYPDPNSGYTGTNVYGVNLNGDYTVAVGGPYRLTTGPVDCSEYRRVQLKFARWLNSDKPAYVSSKVEVSNDAIDWYTIWEHAGDQDITDDSWQTVQYDVRSIADGQSTVYIRWSYEILDSRAFAYSGWNIDDVQVSGIGWWWFE